MRIITLATLSLMQCNAMAQTTTPAPNYEPPPGVKAKPEPEGGTESKPVVITIPTEDKEAMGERDLIAWLVRKPREADGSQGFRGFRSEWKGKPVQVEGFFWDGKVVFEGGEIRCKSSVDEPIAEKGKLVRVMGVLDYDYGTLSRFGSTPPYFYVDVKVAKPIESVDDPHLVGLTAD